MPASLCLNANQNPVVVGAGNTRYAYMGVSRFTQLATEADAQGTCRTAGVFSLLLVDIGTNSTTASSTVRTRKNAGNGAQSVSIGAGATGEFRDDTNSDSVAAGDEINYQAVNGGGGGLGVTMLATVFLPTSGSETVSWWVGAPNLASPSASTTYFAELAGTSFSLGTTEADRQLKCAITGTLRNLAWNITANARSTSTTMTVRINGSDTTVTVSAGAGVTGILEDTAHTAAVSANDLISIAAVTGTGTGDINGTQRVEFMTATRQSILLTTGVTGVEYTFATTPRYMALGGTLVGPATTETRASGEPRFACTASNLRVYITTNSLDVGSASITFRQNAGNTALAASIAAGGGTGWFEDNSDTISVAATDEINHAYTVATASTGVIAFGMVAVVLTTAQAPIPVYMAQYRQRWN